MEKEKWLPVVGYEGRYYVSNLGRVKNSYGKVLRPDTRPKTGYRYIILCNGTGTFHANIHRLVAQAFIPNPENLPIINHKNENPADNRAENLEWCTQSYNVRVSSKHQKTYRAIIQKDLNGNFVARHKSIHEAARAMNRPDIATHICRCAQAYSGVEKWKKHKSVHGYIWEYENITI